MADADKLGIHSATTPNIAPADNQPLSFADTEKAAKNADRLALDNYELGPGQPLASLLQVDMAAQVHSILAALYQPTVDASWLVWEKIIQGSDHPTPMNAQQLQAGLMDLIKKAVG